MKSSWQQQDHANSQTQRSGAWLSAALPLQTSSTSSPPAAPPPRAAVCRCSRCSRFFSRMTLSAGSSSARVTAWLLPAAGVCVCERARVCVCVVVGCLERREGASAGAGPVSCHAASGRPHEHVAVGGWQVHACCHGAHGCIVRQQQTPRPRPPAMCSRRACNDDVAAALGGVQRPEVAHHCGPVIHHPAVAGRRKGSSREGGAALDSACSQLPYQRSPATRRCAIRGQLLGTSSAGAEPARPAGLAIRPLWTAARARVAVLVPSWLPSSNQGGCWFRFPAAEGTSCRWLPLLDALCRVSQARTS